MLHTHLRVHAALTRAKPGNFPKNNALSEIGDMGYISTLSFLSLGSGGLSPASRRRGPVRSRVRPCENCGGKIGIGIAFRPSTSVFPCQYHPLMFHAHLHLNTILTGRTRGGSVGAFKKSSAVSDIGEQEVPSLIFYAFRNYESPRFLFLIRSKRGKRKCI
jgi:hypothetical protein